MEYLAKHNKVWRKVGTDKPLRNRITLKDGEKLTDYEQVPATQTTGKTPPAGGSKADKSTAGKDVL